MLVVTHINTPFFVLKIKQLLIGYGIIKLLETKNHLPKKGVILIFIISYKQLSLTDFSEFPRNPVLKHLSLKIIPNIHKSDSQVVKGLCEIFVET